MFYQSMVCFLGSYENKLRFWLYKLRIGVILSIQACHFMLLIDD